MLGGNETGGIARKLSFDSIATSQERGFLPSTIIVYLPKLHLNNNKPKREIKKEINSSFHLAPTNSHHTSYLILHISSSSEYLPYLHPRG
jgi:hypothetical protein